ncbi:unnamed protein product, partial [Polarella glacialis]
MLKKTNINSCWQLCQVATIPVTGTTFLPKDELDEREIASSFRKLCLLLKRVEEDPDGQPAAPPQQQPQQKKTGLFKKMPNSKPTEQLNNQPLQQVIANAVSLLAADLPGRCGVLAEVMESPTKFPPHHAGGDFPSFFARGECSCG